jgi:transposase
VELYEKIRKAHERDEVSIRELARQFGVHRRDVRAALSSAVPPPRKTPVARPAPVLGPWKVTIDGWLEADKTAPRKQRHTARRVWQRLVDEHDVEVGESTVRRYVAEVRRRQAVPLIEVMVPQHHPLGAEAEVDFGSIHVYLAGVLTELPLFLMRLSASGGGFVRAYLNECQAVFLDGHVRALEHFGGVPGRIRYDNLKAAVANQASRAATRRAEWSPRSAGSDVAISCRSRTSRRWSSSTSCSARRWTATIGATSRTGVSRSATMSHSRHRCWRRCPPSGSTPWW